MTGQPLTDPEFDALCAGVFAMEKQFSHIQGDMKDYLARMEQLNKTGLQFATNISNFYEAGSFGKQPSVDFIQYYRERSGKAFETAQVMFQSRNIEMERYLVKAVALKESIKKRKKVQADLAKAKKQVEKDQIDAAKGHTSMTQRQNELRYNGAMKTWYEVDNAVSVEVYNYYNQRYKYFDQCFLGMLGAEYATLQNQVQCFEKVCGKYVKQQGGPGGASDMTLSGGRSVMPTPSGRFTPGAPVNYDAYAAQPSVKLDRPPNMMPGASDMSVNFAAPPFGGPPPPTYSMARGAMQPMQPMQPVQPEAQAPANNEAQQMQQMLLQQQKQMAEQMAAMQLQLEQARQGNVNNSNNNSNTNNNNNYNRSNTSGNSSRNEEGDMPALMGSAQPTPLVPAKAAPPPKPTPPLPAKVAAPPPPPSKKPLPPTKVPDVPTQPQPPVAKPLPQPLLPAAATAALPVPAAVPAAVAVVSQPSSQPPLQPSVTPQHGSHSGGGGGGEAMSAVALFDYEGRSSDELTFQEGDLIRVTHQYDDGWWAGELRDAKGVFPSNYVQERRNARASWGLN